MKRVKSSSGIRKFMVTPTGGLIINRKSFKDGDGDVFHLDLGIEVKGLIFDNEPDLKDFDPISGFRFTDFSYKNGFSKELEQKLFFPLGFSDKGRKKIEEAFGAWYSVYKSETKSWVKVDDFYIVFGPISVEEVTVNKLIFDTSLLSSSSAPISWAEFHHFRNDGVPESIIKDLTGCLDFSGPTLSDKCALSVNGKKIVGFSSHLKDLMKEASSEFKEYEPNSFTNGLIMKSGDDIYNKIPRPCMLIYREMETGARFELETYGEFRLTNIEVRLGLVRPTPEGDARNSFTLLYRDLGSELLEFKKTTWGKTEESRQIEGDDGRTFDVDLIRWGNEDSYYDEEEAGEGDEGGQDDDEEEEEEEEEE